VQFAGGELSNDVHDTCVAYGGPQPQFFTGTRAQRDRECELLDELQLAPTHLPVELPTPIAVAIKVLPLRAAP
jgi:hypothetical protein